MDENKLRVLKSIDYVVQRTCGGCKHARIPPEVDFGTCTVYFYPHEKHSGEARQLSIHRSGICDRFQWNEKKLEALGGYQQFVPSLGDQKRVSNIPHSTD